jgi:ABC-type nitrate/sulfonate/bicarbonate transport system substrate-binding protein
MKKSVVVGLVIVVAAVVVGLAVRSRMTSETPYTVQIGYLNIVASLPLFVAEEMGFLKEEGVEFKSLPIGTSNQLVDGLIAKNLDCFIEASAVPVLAVELQSPGKLKIFSASEITPQAPFDALLVKETSPIKGIADLPGKKVGVFPGSTATRLLKKHLSDKGVDVSGMTFIPIPPPNMLAALVEGSIDALHAYEPTTAIALSKGGVRQISGSVYAEMLSPNPQGVAAVSTAFMQEHPKAAKKVIRALERGMVFMKEHDAETRKILVSRMKLSEDAAKRCVFLYMLPHSEIDAGVLQKYADMLTGLEELGGRVEVQNLLYRP